MTTATTERTTLPAKLGQAVAELDRLAEIYTIDAREATGRFERTLILAEGVNALRQAVKPLMPRIMPLQGTPLGFLTDKDKQGGYDDATVMECLIEAVLRGLYPVGNEWNIISGRCYVTKSGYARLVRELPGLADLKLQPGVPRTFQGGAVVPFAASWRLEGKTHTMQRDIPVRVNQAMGVDAILGKATRKMLAAVYAEVTGSEHEEGEVGEEPGLAVGSISPPTGGSRTEQLAGKLGAGNGRAQKLAEGAQHFHELEYTAADVADLLGEGFGGVAVESLEDVELDRLLAMLRELRQRSSAGAGQGG